jgi:hypothetical protein
MFNTEDEYLRWLRKKWVGNEWKHLDGYARDKVQARAQRYADFGKESKGLKQSFNSYHTQVLEPWVGSKFFSGARPRIGLYLREYPLPCLDRTRGLLPGHAGRTKLPTSVMDESVREVLRGNTAYRTIEWALKGCRDIVERTFGERFAGDLSNFTDHVVFADWVRPFAMFKNFRGGEFDGKLSKSSCHTAEMYGFAGKLFVQEVGRNGLNLDMIVVMGLGMSEYAVEYLPEYDVWPHHDRAFRTLSGPPGQNWKDSRRRLLVLPHPIVPQFSVALKRLGADVESDVDVVEKRQKTLLEALSKGLRKIILPKETVTFGSPSTGGSRPLVVSRSFSNCVGSESSSKPL